MNILTLYSWIFDERLLRYLGSRYLGACREWALFILAAQTVTWALTREWALARDTTVYVYKP